VILDSSAVVGILRGEPESEALLCALYSARDRRKSAATLVELCIVTDSSRDPVKSGRLDDFLRRSDVEIIEVTAEQAYIARAGDGFGHTDLTPAART
jgi:ribonuclease VapC